MGLIGAENPAVAHLPRAGQRHLNGRRVVCVIVVYRRAVQRSPVFHAAVDARERIQTVRNLLGEGSAEKGRRGGGKRVDHLKFPGLPERDPADRLTAMTERKAPATMYRRQIRSLKIRRPPQAEGICSSPVRLHSPHQLRVVGIGHNAAVLPRPLRKPQK